MCNAHEGAIEQGKEIGKKAKSLEIAKNLLLLGVTIEMIVQATGLSLKDVTEISKGLKHESVFYNDISS